MNSSNFLIEVIEAGIAFCVFAGFLAFISEKPGTGLLLWALAYTPYITAFIMKKRRRS